MAIRWFNIRSRETTTVDSEPQIAALWASSDHSPNITQGQDFGWRLAPEVAVELKKIKQSMPMLEKIAARFHKMVEEVGESDILTYISNKTSLEAAPIAQVGDYQDEYDEAIRNLEQTTTATTAPGKNYDEAEADAPSVTETTTTKTPAK